MKKFSIILTLFFVLVGFTLGLCGQTSAQKYPKTSRFYVSKKGICLTTKKGNADKWKARVDQFDVSWHYSWAGKLPEPEPDGVEFVPMIWGFWGASDGFLKLMDDLALQKSRGQTKHLLGFNEPDQKSQSNMSVERALKAWPHLMKTGLRLGSPGAVHPDNEWMQEFMRKANEQNLRVDFVTMHWYGGPNADSLIQRVKKVHQMYGKPIWITEFAVGDWNAKSAAENRHSPQKVLRFMQEVLPRLDELDYVERYCWFPAGESNAALGTSALFRKDGSLTPLGKFYKSHR
ncbi:MAG: glycoside hydrolase family protein [Opitutaceae bacterium]